MRLTQSEVDQIAQTGFVSESICFGDNTLRYTLDSSPDAEEINTVYKDHHIKVYVPEKVIKNWTETDQVGFSHNQPLDNDEELFILVEKDFKCLKTRQGEDEADMFPNPLEEKEPNYGS